jgi:hypothetical protein
LSGRSRQLNIYYKWYKNWRLFEGIKTYCMFIGYQRSGSTLVRSLLDAHPNAIIAHELNALRLVAAGFDKRQLYQLLLDNSRSYADQGQSMVGYDYKVPNQWQGRFDELRVIGDKKASLSTSRLTESPELLYRLQNTVGTEVKFIHVVRNPYDNIATWCKRTRGKWNREYKPSSTERVPKPVLKKMIRHYFNHCEKNASLKELLGDGAVIDVHHESLMEDPKAVLRELCDFLNLGYEEDYLEDCASIVFKSPHKSRYEVEWDDEMLDAVRAGISRFDFLEGYSFED